MNKMRKLLGALAVVVGVLIVGVTAVALAQEDPAPTDAAQEATATFTAFGQRVRRGWQRLFTPQEKEAALADALNISVDELDAAREAAWASLLDQAVADGRLTQSQADAMQNGDFALPAYLRDLRQDYLPRETVEAVTAEALGMTVDELTAAREAGQRLPEIAAAQGVELSAVREAVQSALAEALAQAVANGRLTQTQADRLLNRAAHLGPRLHGPVRPLTPGE